MSRECIITTDGPHFIWAPGAARESPPNDLELWKTLSKDLEEMRIDCENVS